MPGKIVSQMGRPILKMQLLEGISMDKKVFLSIGIAAVLVLGIVLGCNWFFSGSGSTHYYTQIDNSKFRPVSHQGVIDLSGSGGMDYSYTLTSYDENGGEQDITFGVSRELRESAFLRLTVSPIRGVLNWSEVQYDELPAAVQAHYAPPADH